MSSSNSDKSRLFVIGYNRYDEFGLNRTSAVRQLTQTFESYTISKIHSSVMYTVYSDDDYKNIYMERGM